MPNSSQLSYAEIISKIRDLKASEITDTDIAYEIIVAFADTKTQEQKLIDVLVDHARDVGVRITTSRAKNYLSAYKEDQRKNLANNYLYKPSGLCIDTGKYTCDAHGVRIVTAHNTTDVCLHPIVPICRFEDKENGEMHLGIAFNVDGCNWKTITVPRVTIASSIKIIELASKGVLVTSTNARLLSDYILTIDQLNRNIIPTISAVHRLGWMDNDTFAPFAEAVSYNGDPSMKKIYNAVCAKGDYQTWKNAVNKLRANSIISRIVIAASIASVLIRPCKMTPFFVHLWGGTGFGKSVLLKVAASIWANPAEGVYISSFNSTCNALEGKAAFLSDLPLCIDELQTAVAKGKNDFQDIVYNLSEGISRGRMRKNAEMRETSTWYNTIISTGEQPINDDNARGGASNRVLDIYLDKPIMPNDEIASLMDAILSNYGFAGKMIIDRIKNNLDKIPAWLEKYAAELRKCDVTGKQAMIGAYIMLGDRLAEAIFNDGLVLSDNDIAAYCVSESTICHEEKAMEEIYSRLLANKNKFAKKIGGESDISDCWGYELDGCYYCYQHIIKDIMFKNNYSARAVLTYARSHGYLICNPSSTAFTKTHSLGNGASARFYAIKIP